MSLSALSVLTTFAAVGIFSSCRMGCKSIGSHVCPLGGLSHAMCAVGDLSHFGLHCLCPSHGRLVGSSAMG